MRIEKLWIEDFGKFHQQKFTFAPGLNIFTGANESGKTTMRRFIRAMFYGLDRERGVRARTDAYTKYTPWDHGRFQGNMEFETEEGKFRLFRNFKTTEKLLQITNLTTGKQVSDPEKFLKDAGLVSEMAYCNTLWIGNVCETEDELADELQNYLANVQMTGAAGLDVQKSQDWLKEQKRSLQKKLPEQEIAELNLLLLSEEEERLNYEQLRKEQKQLEEKEQRLKKEQQKELLQELHPAFQGEQISPDSLKTKRDVQKQKQENQRRLLGRAKAVLFCGIVGVLLSLVLLSVQTSDASETFFRSPEMFLLSVLTGILTLTALAGAGLFVSEKKKLKATAEMLEQLENTWKKEQELAAKEYAEFQKTREQIRGREEARHEEEKQILAQLARNAWETERAEERLKCIGEAKERLCELKKQKEQILLEIKAVELAADKITEASVTIYDDFGQRFGQALSTYVQAFTDRAYERLVADEQLKPRAVMADRTVSAGEVSFGTKEQFYLALRLAAADVFDERKKLPLVADDSFAAFDEQRLESALMCLADCGRQVLLFSSTGREEQMAKRMGIAYETVYEDNRENIVEFD